MKSSITNVSKIQCSLFSIDKERIQMFKYVIKTWRLHQSRSCLV